MLNVADAQAALNPSLVDFAGTLPHHPGRTMVHRSMTSKLIHATG